MSVTYIPGLSSTNVLSTSIFSLTTSVVSLLSSSFSSFTTNVLVSEDGCIKYKRINLERPFTQHTDDKSMTIKIVCGDNSHENLSLTFESIYYLRMYKFVHRYKYTKLVYRYMRTMERRFV